MGLKTDTSFLRFLTMGAVGTRAIIDDLVTRGFYPIELERYCTANKIWSTKVKRLRLPDLLCPFTGTRFEARAKSSLAIRMSDAPANPDRTWDAGLRDNDIIALVAVGETEGGFAAPGGPQYFDVASLRGSVGLSKLGPPKSASEGAERDRTWPSIVPSRAGKVLAVTNARLLVEFGGDNRAPRRQTYTLNGKAPYVAVGDRFDAGSDFLAGGPARKADLRPYLASRYDPVACLTSRSVIDRYAAIKAIRHRPDIGRMAVPELETRIREEADPRVALEAASSAAAFGSRLGEGYLSRILRVSDRADLRMEAVFILTELANAFGRAELLAIAYDRELCGTELRQAAAWGLGRMGIGDYEALVGLIGDDEENVGMHAIAGFSELADGGAIDGLVTFLKEGSPREAAAASEALKIIGSDEVIATLIGQTEERSPWVLATLARMPPGKLDRAVIDPALKSMLAPMLLLGPEANWLMSDDRRADIAALQKQLI